MELALPYKIYPISVERPSPRPLHFIIVGAGGTGGYLIRDLARLIGINNNKYGLEISMTIIDGDQVELKNLDRQNFVSPDIGKNKAEINARRYGSTFGVNVGYIPEYVPNDCNPNWKELNALFIQKKCVLIGCADNNRTRKTLHSLYNNKNGPEFFIDAGNEETAGQVVFSGKNFSYCGCSGVTDSNMLGNYLRQMLPDVYERFDLKMDKHPDDLSCAERAESSPQNILTNIFAANIILNFCSIIIKNASMAKISAEYTGERGQSYYENIYSQMRSLVYPIIYFDILSGLCVGEKILDWTKNEEHDIIYKKIMNLNPTPPFKTFLENSETILKNTKNINFIPKEEVVLIGAQ